MKLAVMQPYLFPYIGYFQLVASVDRFVFYDDVNFIKNGWINRNRWLINGEVRYFTVPLRDASPFRSIADIQTVPEDLWRRKLLESMRHAYRHAACYACVSDLVESVVAAGHGSVAELAKASVQAVAGHLGMATQFVKSSSVYENRQLRGANRVIDICNQEQATHYFNLPGGRALYAESEFAAHGVQLHFVDTRPFLYRQAAPGFVPGLSIIDALMHNPVQSLRVALGLEEGERQ